MPFALDPARVPRASTRAGSHSSEHRDLERLRRPASDRDRRRPERARVGGALARGRRGRRGARTCRPRSTSCAVRTASCTALDRSRGSVRARRGRPGRVSRLVSAPNWYRRLPRAAARPLGVRSLRPAGAAWLQPRLEQVEITLSSQSSPRVTSATDRGRAAPRRRLRRTPTTCCSRPATGSRSRLPFLPESLLERIDACRWLPDASPRLRVVTSTGSLPRSTLGLELRPVDALRRRHRVRRADVDARRTRAPSLTVALSEPRRARPERRHPHRRVVGAVVTSAPTTARSGSSAGSAAAASRCSCSPAGDDLLAAKSRYATMQLPFEADRGRERARTLLLCTSPSGSSSPAGCCFRPQTRVRRSSPVPTTCSPSVSARLASVGDLPLGLRQAVELRAGTFARRPCPRTWPASLGRGSSSSSTLGFPLVIKPAVKESSTH